MKFAWDAIFGTLVDMLKPKRLVEVGAFYGHGTRRILEYCREADAVLQTLDPLSPNPAEARGQQEVFDGLVREFPGRLTFHRECSLPLLDRIGPYDAILIDGDHNWYTVIEELRSVERMALTHGIVPLIVLDDVGWPHGRRDCYYVPDRVPEAFRHPHRRAGITPGQSALIDPGGYFQNFHHAEHEGGPATASAPRSRISSRRRPSTSSAGRSRFAREPPFWFRATTRLRALPSASGSTPGRFRSRSSMPSGS